jgi:HEPN domain-containing protein
LLWLQLADEDLAMARLALEQDIYRQTCFPAQQAAEKALKAFLLARRGTYPNSHSLEQLLMFDTSDELRRWALDDATSIVMAARSGRTGQP